MATRRSTQGSRTRRAASTARRTARHSGRSLPRSGAAGAQIGNVAGLGSGADARSRSGRVRTRSNAAHARTDRRSRGTSRGTASRMPSGGPVITRRHLIAGAVGVGALAAIGGGVYVATHQNDSDDIDVLEVPESAVSSSNDLGDSSPAEEHMRLAGNFELPYGTLVFSSSDRLACCIVPSETANPLCAVGLLWLGSGNLSTVLSTAQGQEEGFQIYDARATDSGLVWIEEDILEGTWRVYTAPLSSDGALGSPALADEGGGDWETPSIAAAGSRAFWQVMPKVGTDSSSESSLVKSTTFGSSDVQTVWTSKGRLATAPYACADAVVITPRTDTSSTHYQLTRIDASSCNATDTLVLPTRMSPLEAGFGDTGFMFSFDAIYNYGGGIANLGTYCPAQDARGADYSAAPWFRFARTPSAAPAWCGGYLMVKSTTSVCGVDLATREWFTLGMENGSDDYGDYLATTGSVGAVVTYANIDHTPLGGEHIHCCRVRVWKPV